MKYISESVVAGVTLLGIIGREISIRGSGAVYPVKKEKRLLIKLKI
jgi:hypothetical protein